MTNELSDTLTRPKFALSARTRLKLALSARFCGGNEAQAKISVLTSLAHCTCGTGVHIEAGHGTGVSVYETRRPLFGAYRERSTSMSPPCLLTRIHRQGSLRPICFAVGPVNISRCILLVGSTARTYILMDLIPRGGHKRAIQMWGHFYLVGLPYLTFGGILVLVALSIALQITLTNNTSVGVTVGFIIVALSLAFSAMWIWADAKLGETLKSMLSDAPSFDAAVHHVSWR